MKKVWLILVMLAVSGAAKADPNSQALITHLQVKAQECYPDSRYVVVNQALIPKPQKSLPQNVPVYVPVYTVPQPQVYLGFGYTYSNWSGHNRGHCGNHNGGGHRSGGNRH
jgi:hypothetical protein